MNPSDRTDLNNPSLSTPDHGGEGVGQPDVVARVGPGSAAPRAEGDPGGDVLNIIAEVESRLERLRLAAADNDEAVDAMRRRQLAPIEQQRLDLDLRAADLDERQRRLDEQAAKLAQREKHAESLCELADSERRDVESAKSEMQRQRMALEADLAGGEALRQQVASEQEAARRERADVNAERERLAEAQRRLAADREALEQCRREIDAGRHDLDRRGQELVDQRARWEEEHRNADRSIQERIDRLQSEHQAQLNGLRVELGASRHAADEAGARAAQSAEQLQRLGAEVGPLRDAAARLESEKQTLQAQLAERQQRFERTALRADSLQADLDALTAKIGEHQTAIAKHEQAIRARDEQLEAAKRKLLQLAQAFEAQSARIEAGTVALQTLAQRERELESAKVQANEASARLETLAAQTEELKSHLAERDSWIAELEAKAAAKESDSSGSAADVQALAAAREELAARDEAIARLSEHIRDLQGELECARRDVDADSGRMQELIASQREQIAQLERRVEQEALRADAATAGASEAESSRQGLTAARVQFLERRRRRLDAMRAAVRDRARRLNQARDVLRGHAAEMKECSEERQALLEVKQNLEIAERRMIRRWAVAGAATRLFIVLLTLCVLAAGSYFGVMSFWPATYTANATVQAKGRPGFALTPEQAALWQTVHEEMLLSDGVIESVAQRLEQRGYTDLSEPAALRAYLEANLRHDSAAPGTIGLHLNAQGRDEALRLMETYSIALVSASNADRGRRTDGATTALAEPAALDPTPVKDNRRTVACIVFGASALATFMLALPIHARLRRAQSVFQDAEELFVPLMDDRRWAEINKGATGPSEHVIG